ncbi:MAG: single-stranded DNA-binding protein [Ralstonia sp.]|nr:MAG: single-stranded DNA-binding protein [Ralstonia sp.]
MAAINTFTIIGNVTKDIELRYTGSGTPSVTYTVAVDNVWYDNNGTKHEECDFIPVTTYGKQAENDAKYLKKGSAVAVIGRIRSWYKQEERKGGFNFEAERVQYLGKPSGNGGRQGNAGTGNAGTGNAEHDDWMRDYDRTEQAGTQQPQGNRRR